MKCPFCHHTESKVIDTRRLDTAVLRIRICESCWFGWQTQEILINYPPKVMIYPSNYDRPPK